MHWGSLILVVSTDSLVARTTEKSLRNRLDQDATPWEFLGPFDFFLISHTYPESPYNYILIVCRMYGEIPAHMWVRADNPVRCTTTLLYVTQAKSTKACDTPSHLHKHAIATAILPPCDRLMHGRMPRLPSPWMACIRLGWHADEC